MGRARVILVGVHLVDFIGRILKCILHTINLVSQPISLTAQFLGISQGGFEATTIHVDQPPIFVGCAGSLTEHLC